ncbi:MAG TPA: hypothetical protein VKM37_00990 [Balneolaceae bacterium]|nr:hypothetical protein [Balneolaceae bacterium]
MNRKSRFYRQKSNRAGEYTAANVKFSDRGSYRFGVSAGGAINSKSLARNVNRFEGSSFARKAKHWFCQ